MPNVNLNVSRITANAPAVAAAAQGVELNGTTLELADSSSPAITKSVELSGQVGQTFEISAFSFLNLLSQGVQIGNGTQVNVNASFVNITASASGTIQYVTLNLIATLLDASSVSAVDLGTPTATLDFNGTTIRFNNDRIQLGSTLVDVRTGSGSPEGIVTAPVGSLFLRNDGSSGTTLYIKESGAGNTGWVAVNPSGSSLTAGDAITIDGTNIELGSATPATKTISIIGAAGFDFGAVLFDNIPFQANVEFTAEAPSIVLDASTKVTIDTPDLGITSSVVRLKDTGTPVDIRTGTGTPEGVVTANPGSLFLRTDGGAGATLYVKETGVGNTGWAAK